LGPTPRVTILDPEQIKDVFNKIYDFPKPNANPLVRLLASGLASHEGEKWSKHRRLINPAFNLEKLKVSCLHLLDIDLCSVLKHIRKKLGNLVLYVYVFVFFFFNKEKFALPCNGAYIWQATYFLSKNKILIQKGT